jgi:hypothetical protein
MGIVDTERNGLEVKYTLKNEKVRKLLAVFFEEDPS